MFSRRAFLALLPAPFVARFLPTPPIATPGIDQGIYRYICTFVDAAGETLPGVIVARRIYRFDPTRPGCLVYIATISDTTTYSDD